MVLPDKIELGVVFKFDVALVASDLEVVSAIVPQQMLDLTHVALGELLREQNCFQTLHFCIVFTYGQLVLNQGQVGPVVAVFA